MTPYSVKCNSVCFVLVNINLEATPNYLVLFSLLNKKKDHVVQLVSEG